MSKQEYWTHWLLGLACAAIWFWGDKAGIPVAAQALAASVVPALVTHAVGMSRGMALGGASFPAGAVAAAAPVVNLNAAAQPEEKPQ